jgi:chromosome condensin MukBEF ATPase and DNA-binding subunit MukB
MNLDKFHEHFKRDLAPDEQVGWNNFMMNFSAASCTRMNPRLAEPGLAEPGFAWNCLYSDKIHRTSIKQFIGFACECVISDKRRKYTDSPRVMRQQLIVSDPVIPPCLEYLSEESNAKKSTLSRSANETLETLEKLSLDYVNESKQWRTVLRASVDELRSGYNADVAKLQKIIEQQTVDYQKLESEFYKHQATEAASQRLIQSMRLQIADLEKKLKQTNRGV